MRGSLRIRIVLAALLTLVGMWCIRDYLTTQPGRGGGVSEGVEVPQRDEERPVVMNPPVDEHDPARCLLTLRSDLPVAAAEVYLLPWAQLHALADAHPPFGPPFDAEPALAAAGTRLDVGADGTASFLAPEGPYLVMARLDGAWGIADVPEPGANELSLALEPAPPLRVRVVDARGAPVGGVPVAIRCQEDFHAHDLRLAVSAEDTGLVEMPRAVSILALHEEHGEEEGESHFVAALAVCTREPVQVPFDPHAPPAEPIELALPPVGALEVRLHCPNDVPDEDAWITLRPVAADGSLPDGPAVPFAGRAASFGKAPAVFDHVALGLDLDVMVWVEGYRPVIQRVRGPRDEGAREVVDVSFDAAGFRR